MHFTLKRSMTEPKTPKNGDHVPHKVLPRETREYQPSSQWRYGEGNKRCIRCALLFTRADAAVQLEVLEVREEPDEIQDLSARAIGLFECKESKCWREVSEALSNGWHKVGYLKIVYSEFLEVCERREAAQGAPAEPAWAKHPGAVRTSQPQADSESFDEWK